MLSECACPVLAQVALKLFPSDSKGISAAGTLGDIKIVLLTVNGAPAPDPTAYIGGGDDRSDGRPYLQSTDNVGDVLEFEISATLTTSSGVKAVTQRATLTVVNQLDDHQYRAIGTVAVAWALLEARVHTAFAALLAIKANEAHLIASRMRRIEILFEIMQVSVNEKLDQAACDEFGEIRARVKELEILRNKYIHAVWWRSGDPSVAKGQLKTRPKQEELGPIAISRIEQLAHDLNATNARIIAFLRNPKLRSASS